ncbi:hypothetical protein GYB59_23175 [bacterium]|nr:hypothetical protein [bacterium]
MTKPRLEYESDLVIQDRQGEIQVRGEGARLILSCSDFPTVCRFVRNSTAVRPAWLASRPETFLAATGTTLELAVGDRSIAVNDGRKTAFTNAGWIERMRLAFHFWRANADRKRIWR